MIIKNKKNLIFLIIILIVFMNNFIYAKIKDSSPGTSDFQFLKMDVGGRTLAMGGAFTGVADDISAIRYNPAGLRMLLKPEISVTDMEWIGGLRATYFAYGKPVGTSYAIGLSVFSLASIDEIMGRDDEGNKTNSLKYQQMYATLGWATRLDRYDTFLFGLNIKYAEEVLDYSSNSTVLLDSGLLFKLYRNMNLGFAIRNLGFNATDNVPVEYRAGLSYLQKNLGLSMDGYKFTDTDMRYAFGLEYFIKEVFVIRSGYNTSLRSMGQLNEDESMYSLSKYARSGLSIGFGILTKPLDFLGGYSIKFDYGIVDYGRLGFTHIFSLGTEF